MNGVQTCAPPISDNLPLALLGRRPDIVSARWGVEAQLKGVDVAKARFYPDVNLNAAFGFSTFGLGKLLNASSQTIQAGPVISLPIFDGGRLRANLKGQYAAYESAVANYDSTLNKALGDIADRMSSIRSADKQMVSQRVAQDAAQRAYDLAVDRYKAGLTPQLTVLTAESSLLAANGQEAHRVAAGHFSEQAEHNPLMLMVLLIALSLVSVGNGFFKPNISTMVGELYQQGDRRRDAGFTIFYMGINVGAMFGRDRTTVSYGCLKVEYRRDDPVLDRTLDLLGWALPTLVMRAEKRPN